MQQGKGKQTSKLLPEKTKTDGVFHRFSLIRGEKWARYEQKEDLDQIIQSYQKFGLLPDLILVFCIDRKNKFTPEPVSK